MPILDTFRNFASRLMASRPDDRAALSVDAVEDRGRRKAPQQLLRSEDDDIGPMLRRGQVITLGRDIRRNYAVAAWAIRKHLDYVSSFTFQARTGDKKLDDRIEELMEWHARAGKFEVTGRHNRRRYLRLAEAARTVDGDMLTVFLNDGRLQAIEADRVRTPQANRDGVPPVPPETLKRMKWGVVLSESGAAEAFAVNRRGPQYSTGPDLLTSANSFQFERLVSARNAHLLGYFERFDQVRGNSPLISALNAFRDTYEGIDYALMKAKVSQLFAIAILRKATGGLEGVTSEDGRTEIDFNRGPIALDLDPDEDVKVVESSQPSDQWQAFMNLVIAVSLKSLDIPFCYYDESKVNYSSYRGASLQYEQSSEAKRDDLRDFLDRYTAWRLAIWVYNGILELPAGFDLARDTDWEWISTGIPWIDPLKEVSANGLAVDRGFESTISICRAMGKDAYEVADEEAAYQKYRRDVLGMEPTGVKQPIQVTTSVGTHE